MKIQTYLIILCSIFFASCSKDNKTVVPIISESLIQNIQKVNKLEIIDHHGNQYAIENNKGRLQLVNFFFINCKTICPLMNDELNTLAENYPEINFLSFTIDPFNDTIDHLSKYHKQRNMSSNQVLLRTSQENLITISDYYLSSLKENDLEILYHTSYVVLLDKQLRIRGLYDTLDTEDLKILKSDIEALK